MIGALDFGGRVFPIFILQYEVENGSSFMQRAKEGEQENKVNFCLEWRR